VEKFQIQERTVHQFPNVIGVSVRRVQLRFCAAVRELISRQIRLGFSYSARPQLHSGLFSGIFKKFDKAAGVIQAKVCARSRMQLLRQTFWP
jgi:hypothetical protein